MRQELYADGRVIVWPAFSSTTAEPKVASEFLDKNSGSLFILNALPTAESGGRLISMFSAFEEEQVCDLLWEERAGWANALAFLIFSVHKFARRLLFGLFSILAFYSIIFSATNLLKCAFLHSFAFLCCIFWSAGAFSPLSPVLG